MDKPAVMVKMTDQSRSEISRVVSQALNKKSVIIGNDAFATNNLLLIERRRHQTIEGHLPMARETDLPNQFRLYIRGDQCVLLHVQKNQIWPLREVKCRAQ